MVLERHFRLIIARSLVEARSCERNTEDTGGFEVRPTLRRRMVLRHAAVVGVLGAILVAGCGQAVRYQECGATASCAARHCDASLGDRPILPFYLERQRALPPVIGSRQVSWNCGRPPSTMQIRRGIPASVAVFDGERAYIASDLPLRSARNPLQPYYFPRASPVPRRGCRAHVARGRIDYVDAINGLVAFSPHERFSIAVDTVIHTPRVDGVPRLTPGRRVTVHALRCSGRKILVARSISG
jgi:hypothetical protein